MSENKLPEWFKPWQEVGFIRPESARRWMTFGFKPEDAAPWYHLDGVAIHIAAEWLEAGYAANDYLMWSSAGFLSPKTASAWKRHFSLPSEAARWKSAGLRIDGHYGDLLDRGYSPQVVLHADLTLSGIEIDELSQWLNQFDDKNLLVRGDLQRWMNSGLSPEEIKYWLDRDLDLGIVIDLRSRDWLIENVESLFAEWGRSDGRSLTKNPAVTAEMALGWSHLEIPRNVAQEWVQNLFSPSDAKKWNATNVSDPNTAAQWKKNGCSPDDVAILNTDGWASPMEFAGLKRHGWSIADVVSFWLAGIGRATIESWIELNRMNHARWQKFLMSTVRSNSISQWSVIEIPHVEWPQWIDLISTSPEICRQWFSTGTSPSSLASKFRLAQCTASDFDESLTGQVLLNVLDSRVRAKHSSRPTRSTSSRLVGPTSTRLEGTGSSSEVVFRPLINSESIEEFQAKAIYLSGFIRKAPRSGMEFHDFKRGILIRIERISYGSIEVVVAFGQKSLNVEFDQDNFDPISGISNLEEKAAYILAVSWFIDCAVSLRSGARAMSTNFRSSSLKRPENSGTHVSRSFRYVPTPSFDDAVKSVRGGGGVRPVLHEVAGHIRRLPTGWTPSEDAVSRAPIFLRRKMKANETFVMPHYRGNEREIVEFINRLSKYSMTAHAFEQVLE